MSNKQRRKLAKHGKKLRRKRLKEYASIATTDTILYWHRKLVALKYTAKRKINTERQEEMAIIKELCVKFAEENPSSGYDRIHGALSNLGYEVCASTVGNILRAAGVEPSPERMKKSNWKQFVRSHMDTICVADFLTAEVWAMSGLVRNQVLFVMNLARRHVQIAQISCQMNGEVMAQVARNLKDSEDGFLDSMEYFVCDHDVLFTKHFEAILESSDLKLLRTRVATPQQNGFAERFVKSMKEECLKKLIRTQGFCRRSAPRNFGEKSLKRAVNEYAEYYHHESPRSAALATNHQGLDNLIPFPNAAQTKGQDGSVVKLERRTVPRVFGSADS